ncbi:MAG TPA: GAF domain-containing protein, partial [Candidatus Eisenbacteria bacterium]|nr:GAF domain-containing protein [Candidatus Eisenbacteria bacterium]
MDNATLIEFLPDPALILSGNGQTERANEAARELVTRLGLKPDLQTLFGRDVAELLGRALREGSAQGILPVATRQLDPPVFRVAIRRMGGTGRLTAVLTDMSKEFAWREQLAARNRELAALNEVGAALSASLDLDSLAQRIYEQASRILDTRNFYIALHDEATGMLTFAIRVEDRQVLPDLAPRPLGNGLTEYVLRSGQPRLINGDVLAEATALGLTPIGRPSSSWLGVPLLAEGKGIGVIAVQDHAGSGGYDEHDLEVLTLIAGQASAAVRNARLLAQARAAYQELRQTQAELLETERLRSITETVGGLNHEINNPLAAIAGNAQLLQREASTLSPAVQEKVKRILEGARRIQNVTSKMSNLIHATSMPYPAGGAIL